MDFLADSERKLQMSAKLESLERRKQELVQRLEALKKEQFEILDDYGDNEGNILGLDLKKMREVRDTYSLTGVSIQSLGPDLVLTFSPAYGNTFSSSEQRRVQFLRNGENLQIGEHSLPPFVDTEHLQKECSRSLPVMVEKIKQLLDAYVRRRDGLKLVKETFKDSLSGEPEVNLAVTFVKLRLKVDEQLPVIEVILQYSQSKCLPDSVDIKFDNCDRTYSISKKKMDHLLQKWTSTLSMRDIYSAVADIIGKC